MEKISRREFLKVAASLAVLMGLDSTYHQGLAEGLEELTSGRVRVIWMAGQSCTGCSVSFLNADYPAVLSIITKSISLVFHPTINAAQGDLAIETLMKNIDNPGYVLVFEGSIPMGMPRACLVGDQPIENILPKAIQNARLVAAIGTCAAFGGMPAAEGNPTGAASVQKFMKSRNLSEDKLVALPTCPDHPETLIGVLTYYLKFGMPERDTKYRRPKLFYSCSIHAECPRFHYFQNEIFAQNFGDESGCLFKLGCLGPLSYANCPRRQWNKGINWCIRANAPCLSCSSEYFCSSKDLPFYRKGEKYRSSVKPRIKKEEEN